MKKYFLLVILFRSITTFAQTSCNCDFQIDIRQDPNNLCCFDISICNNGGPNCNPVLQYGPLLINTNGTPFYSGEIGSVNSLNTFITASQNGLYQAIFSSNFIALTQNCITQIAVGRICMNAVPNGIVEFSAQLNQQGNICDINVQNAQFVVPSCTPPLLLQKLYGDDAENIPTAIKAFGDGLYVSGYRIINNVEYGTISKFDFATGVLMWENQLSIPSRINDFEFEPGIDSLYLVGWTSPLSSSIDNRSIFIRMGKSGIIDKTKFYDQNGREGFSRIIRHPNAPDPAFPYYILGRKNAVTSFPSADDVVVLFNMNAHGKCNWVAEYANNVDNEFYLGLVPMTNGKLLVTGLTMNFDGALLEIDGVTGNALFYDYNNQPMDIYDAIEFPGGFIVVAGEDVSHEAILTVVNNMGGYSSNSQMPSFRFPDITNFQDVWKDRYDNLYVVGSNKNSSLGINYPVVFKFHYFQHAGVVTITPVWAKYFYDNETRFSDGKISVTPGQDQIFYSDARDKGVFGFGKLDMLVGAHDLDLNGLCTNTFPINTFPYPITASSFTLLPTILPEPPYITSQVQPLTYCCTPFCESQACMANFSWILTECFQAQFHATIDNCLPGLYNYEWDFDGDGYIDATSNSPTISHNFSCGGGTFNVCLTVTNPMGCVASICYMVNIPDKCCPQVVSSFLGCGADPNEYYFNITVQDPSTFGISNCSYACYNTNPGALVTIASTTPTANGAILEGLVTVPNPIPSQLTFTIQSTCLCPSGAHTSCTMDNAIPTICCKRIQVDEQFVCYSEAVHDVPIITYAWPPLNNVSQVSWYAIPAPQGGCPAGPLWGGVPFQQTSGGSLEPLHLHPNTMTSDLCIYAVVDLNDGPCKQLISNIATVHRCDASSCSMSGQEYCYFGACISPGPLMLNITSPPNACPNTITWLDYNDNVVQTGGTTYVPTACIDMVNPLNCYEDYVYKVKITDACGTHTCSATIRLYSDFADPGTLIMDPAENLPLCFNGDATLKFIPGCTSNPPGPKTWSWSISYDGSTFSPLSGGNMNPIWNTNKVTQHTWYAVTTQNGPPLVCPPKQKVIDIDVRNPLMISYFDAHWDLPCLPTAVDLEVQFDPPPPDPLCPVKVEWYKDGNLIGVTTPPATSPAFYTYPIPINQNIAGNYYCMISNECCEEKVNSSVITILPPMKVKAEGPCFICDMMPDMLQGYVFNVVNSSCSYSWTAVIGNIVSQDGLGGAVIDQPGIYVFTATCTDLYGNICTKQVSVTVPGCASLQIAPECGLIFTGEENLISSTFNLYPNPNNGEFILELLSEAKQGTIAFVYDLTGQLVSEQNLEIGQTLHSMALSSLSDGIYFIQIHSEYYDYGIQKFVKQ